MWMPWRAGSMVSAGNIFVGLLVTSILAIAGMYVACSDGEQSGTPIRSVELAFLSSLEGNEEIYVIRDDGSGLRNITNNPADDGTNVPNEGANFDWAPDGKRMAFTSEADIYVIGSDGSNRTRVTADGDDSQPRWSPDGSRIAFVSERRGTSKIYVMNADGSGQSRLTDASESFHESFPAWSRDGTRIAFEGTGEDQGIYVIHADGSGQTKVTDRDDRYYAPVWSPDGSKIAATCQCLASNKSLYNQIFVVSAAGSAAVVIPADAKEDSHYDSPAWSPDGGRIAYNALLEGKVDVYIARADGSDAHRLTDDGASGTPAWSPDGSRLAILRVEDVNGEKTGALYLISAANGSTQTMLTSQITDPPILWGPETR
jgi:Tol biopolymer transport system component